MSRVREQGEGLPPILANQEQMVQVLMALMLNAVDAMPQGGLLKLRTGSDGNSIRLVVSDTGVGTTTVPRVSSRPPAVVDGAETRRSETPSRRSATVIASERLASPAKA